MDNLKLVRKSNRTILEMTIVLVEDELSKTPPDVDLPGILMDSLDKIEDLEMKLSESDTEILEAILQQEGDGDKDAKDKAYNEELQSIHKINDRIRTTKRRIRQAMAPPSAQSVVASSPSVAGKKSYKLPKIEIRKFTGELTEYMGWWAQFEKIHLDEDLHSTDKFQYLIQATVEGSKARRLVEGYPQTAANYPKVIAAINDRYGDKVLLTEMYVRQLARMVIANASKSNRPSLSTMYDELESSLRALESLGVTTDSSAAFLYPLVESSLPEELLKVWQRSALSGYDEEGEDTPVDKRLSSLMKFLRKEVKGAERLSFVSAGLQSEQREKRRQPQEQRQREEQPATAASLFTSATVKCVFCEKSHESKDCSRGSFMSLTEKKSKVEKRRCCFTCLKPGHNASKCRSFVKCVVCGKKHQTIMCPEVSSARSGERSTGQEGGASTSTTLAAVTCTNSVYLQTLRINLKGPKGTKLVRALIDTGSQHSFIVSSTATSLGFPVIGERRMSLAVFGGGRSEEKRHKVHSVDVLYQIGGRRSLRMQLVDQERICTTLPQVTSGTWHSELRRRGIFLSDFGPGPEEVEVLFGADLCPRILKGRIEKVGSIAAIETEFGWTILGKNEDSADNVSLTSLVISSCLSTIDVDKLWRLDSLGIMDPITRATQEEDDIAAKQHFLAHVTRSEDGRYCIALPWANGVQLLPSNKAVAFRRLESTTKKLKDFGLYETYNNIFEMWLSEGLIEATEIREEGCHYLPHRAVLKPESLTTPTRPVFDGSSKSGRNPSLNECLHKGPNEIQLIPTMLHGFRRNKYGVVADIRKAYQMIDVREEDRKYLQFLWWTKDGKVMAYRHRRVVFGVNCSAFLLAAVLEYHLSQCEDEEKETAEIVRKSTYVDNLLTSLRSQEKVEKFRHAATKLLSTAKMELREWEWTSEEGSGVGSATHSGRGLELVSRGSHVDRKGDSNVLGLRWNKAADTFTCDIPTEVIINAKVTKRIILSSVAKIFDPLGWCCPATLIPKLLLQESWSAKCSWDDEVPSATAVKFREWASETQYLKLISVPRWAFQGEGSSNKFQLHTFMDASQCAYAAVTFVRVEDCGRVQVQLLEARAKVAPLKSSTIPRLELMGCLIGARLSRSTREAYSEEDPEEFFWSDSTVALAWIRRNDNWGTFVGNRVKEILSLTNASNWRHVPGEMNPADLPSRGCSPQELLQSRWWEGPEWLRGPIETWPATTTETNEEVVKAEMKKTPPSTVLTVSSPHQHWYVAKFSSYIRNVRVFCFMRRFIEKLRRRSIEKGKLTVGEIREGEEILFGLIQSDTFPKNSAVIEGLRVTQVNGLYRVHTKLLRREDTEDFRSPIVLPSHHPLTKQLIRQQHYSLGHSGVQSTVTSLRERVWIIRTRKTVKAVLSKCVTCRKYAAKPSSTPVAPLPANRVRDAKTFEVTGVDLAGPLHLKCGRKTWIVLFTCAVYRCVHLEVVESLSTEDFLLALQRFACRRGRPVTIYSDNGTNFVGANNLFLSIDWDKVEEEAAVQRIEWIFNPPSAAWWGGFWERLIRIVKDQLKRMLGRNKLGLNELVSLLCVVESQVNGRPLTYVSEDEDDLAPLTPQMFLTDLKETTIPEVTEMTGTKMRMAVKTLRKLREELKSRFRKEYLAELVHRGKSGKATIGVGDIVLVGNDLQKRTFWPMGRIVELLPGSDGAARVAKVRVKEGILTRPIQRLFPLEVSSEDEMTPPKPTGNQEEEEELEEPQVITRSGRQVKKPDRFGSAS